MRELKIHFWSSYTKAFKRGAFVLAKTAQQKDLKDLKIIITHLKPGGNRIETIKKELTENNPLKVQLIFPEQGQKIQL